MLLEDEDTVEIEKITSHRIIGDDLKYKIKLKGSDDQEWVSPNYLKFYKENLLYAYDKENSIDTKKNEVISIEKDNNNIIQEKLAESKFPDTFGSLALTFIEEFGIKMEVALADEDTSTVDDNSNLLRTMEFGAAEFMINNPTIRPCSPPTMVTQIQSDDDFVSGYITDVSDSNTDYQLDDRDCESVEVPQPSLTTLSDVENEMNNSEEQEITAVQKKKKNITIGKVKKATKPLSESRNNYEENRTVKSLMSSSQLSNISEPIDKIFYNLPVVMKIVPTTQGIENLELSPITIGSLLSIVNSNNLKLLHQYSQSDPSSVELILRNNPYLLVTAVNNNTVSMVSALLELGANVEGKDSSGSTPLMVACDNENEAIIDVLINNGASINQISDGKNCLLCRCIRTCKLTSLKLLLQLGIDFSSVESLITDKSSQIGRIFEEHKKSLWMSIEEKMLILLGPNARINKVILSPRVVSLFEASENQYEMTFLSNISPIIENQCNLLFLITGLLHGSSMKFLIDDSNRVTSVLLNDINQHAVTEGKYLRVTSFSPVKDEENRVVIKFDMEQCRKIRLVLMAVSVSIPE